ncbi:MAG: dihydroorotate dehydrogenase-like protein [Acidobacteriia bacterium]|nr:dihydroorotate dehydrogenase-like protein [Terriglobia bacterium]
MNLSTKYLGLTLAHPFMMGASPLADHLDTVKRLEDGGASAIVLRSLFEEQITMAESGRIHHMDPLDAQFAGTLAGFPMPDRFPLSPDDYLEHLRRAKAAVRIPVIASLNGTNSESWLRFALRIQEAGADALELNMYEVATNPDESSAAIEFQIRNVVVELKQSLKIPIAVKLGPFFTAFGHLASQLDQAHTDGLVLFNRFYQPDIDIREMKATPHLELSTSAELLLRLRWMALLHSRVRCSLALTGGVSTPTDGIKALLAGAHAVQIVSAIMRHGPPYFTAMREGLTRWMEAQELTSVDAFRGRVNGQPGDTEIAERANYIRTLQSWAPHAR